MQLTARLSILVFLLVVSACRRQGASPPIPIPDPVSVPSLPVNGTDEPTDGDDRVADEREGAERLAEAVRNTLREPIHFDFDRSDLNRESRTALDKQAEWLRRYPTYTFLIEGHADERGSSEYNLALGQRRAAAARRYLTLRDISGHRIDIATWGEEQPVCETSDEWCWRINRRDEFVLIP